ncbi:unnamed protein product [Alopecurus aequalis]
MEIEEDDSGETMPEMEAPGVSTVAIAVSRSRSSRHALKWALDKFVPGGQVFFRILHVRPPITMVPTPMGNYIPISQVRDDVASAYREELEWQARNMLLPFKKMCAQRQVEAEAVLLESDDVPSAISEEIDKFNIGKLVLGSSSKSIFRRKLKVSKTASKISECIPSFCTAYIISKGKLSFVHSATTDTCETPKSISSSTVSSPSTRSLSSSTRSEWVHRNGTENVSFHQTSLSSQHDHALTNGNKFSNRGASSSGSACSEISYHDETTLITNSHSITSEAQFSHSSSSENSIQKSFRRDSFPDSSDLQAAVSEIATSLKHSHDQDDLKLEIENIKVKLRHLQKLHEVGQTESVDSPPKNNSEIWRGDNEIKFQEIDVTEETVRRLVRQMTREEHGVTITESQVNQDSSEREATQTNDDHQGVVENKIGQKIVGRCFTEYNRYSWEQIQAATSSFSSDLVIGKGTYGTVYKAKFQHMVAAVKVLNSLEGCGSQQLQQELEVLGKIRHPHLLLLLGACPEHGCVVYEFMENGSLDDMFHDRRNGMPPLAWYDRIRIAWEVATAVAFLHSARPDPIIHRDLKPANILLDRNLTSKVGDVGLSTALLHPVAGATGGGGPHPLSTMVKNTAPVGTFCYIDPEYQRTGAVSAKSDVYALGVVVLQLLTGRTSPLGLAHAVETALEDGGGAFADMLDDAAGEWPLEEARELAALALRCAEMRRRDRPGLREHVLPALERIKDVAAKAALLLRSVPAVAPGHFLCPILQEVMVDPVVASDGYTYDRKAIEMWLSMKGKSPMTNLKLQSRSLIPNHSLRSAIMDWRSGSK